MIVSVEVKIILVANGEAILLIGGSLHLPPHHRRAQLGIWTMARLPDELIFPRGRPVLVLGSSIVQRCF